MLQGRGEWYDGRPILITSNDYSLELFNGDVGVIAVLLVKPTGLLGKQGIEKV